MTSAAEEAEIAMRGAADGRAVGRRVGMRRIGADGDVHGDGDAGAVGVEQQARFGARVAGALVQCPPERLSHADAVAIAFDDGAVHFAPGLFGGAEASVGQDGFHVFAGVSGEGDFEIVNGGGTIQGEAGGVAAAHQIEQHRREAALDDVSAHAPEDGALVPARAGQGIHDGAKAVGGEEVRQRIEKSGNARRRAGRARRNRLPSPCRRVPSRPTVFRLVKSSGCWE